MFNLEQSVREWCDGVHPYGRKREERIAELADHVYSEVERLQADGLSEEQAFLQATEQAGNPEELMLEHSKNRSDLMNSYVDVRESVVKKGSIVMDPKRSAFLIIVVSLFFAGCMILASSVLKDQAQIQVALTVLMSIWWVPFAFLIAKGIEEKEHSAEAEQSVK